MKFATIGHLLTMETLNSIPPQWIKDDQLIVSPEINADGTVGYILGLKLTAAQMMQMPVDIVRQHLLTAALYAQQELDVDFLQLGALTTSVSNGGVWLTQQEQFTGFVNHGDSYTAAITCQTVLKTLKELQIQPSAQTIAIVGAYGIIGEAVSKILVPQFSHAILIGRKQEKLDQLAKQLKGHFETTCDLTTRNADIIITATSHPTALLESKHLKHDAIVVDVSQPPNLSFAVCSARRDVHRIDGGYVDFPRSFPIPGMPQGKIFACIAEVIMQTKENDKHHHVGTIDLDHLKKTENWATKYGYTLNQLTNFGNILHLK